MKKYLLFFIQNVNYPKTLKGCQVMLPNKSNISYSFDFNFLNMQKVFRILNR